MDIKKLSFLKANLLLPAKKLIRYYDIGFILNNIESIILLPCPIIYSKESKELYNQNKKLYEEILLKASKTYEMFVEEQEKRKDIFKYLRLIDTTFCYNMNEKISKEDYSLYVEYTKKLFSDLSNEMVTFKNRDINYDDLFLSHKDSLSNIIDSEKNSQIAFIEDNFVLGELNRIDISKISNSNMLRKVLNLKEELEDRIKKHEIYKELMSKENSIVLKSSYKDCEGR